MRAPAPERGRRYMRDPGERRLIEVLERIELRAPADLAALVPLLGRAVHHPRARRRRWRAPLPLAQKAAHCLRALEVFEPAGMRGRAPLHRVA